MNGRDRRAVDQRGLLLQTRVPRAFFQLPFDRRANPLLHLSRRSLGKCHDKQTVHVHRGGFFGKPLYDALHEHRCLS